MPTIILLRHGETHWNRQQRIQGHGDSPLTLKGIDQARAYGRAVAPLLGAAQWRLVSSPLSRCMQTMAIFCEVAGLDFARVERDARLKEVSTGEYSGRLKAEFPPGELGGSGRQSWFFHCPGGESHDHMVARLSAWLESLSENDHVIAVSHGIAGKVLRGLYCGWDPDSALAQDSPQDALFLLRDGQMQRLACP
ncbi:Probable phosphoglycerate mutase gpmB [Magnetospirillum gryphiswaldense MSR-1 v2]|uniref:Probable phosphoglycerate mutase gpmB n=1 Tax=Magnetospirillum gryphiswaldense (strain DSM 6361 / JCM 21280 / NBRC 15271 / MSR-1) TaxID=431944 RepID=V6F6A7_MAGGM|nr:histidine phosphatase family protein [Magnetospirillum gryphiswaldense]CDL00902.1 Probable phosphoglycerate mutase gpmB [Magnetospirillum gryphiswaldense MSR-1 v2]